MILGSGSSDCGTLRSQEGQRPSQLHPAIGFGSSDLHKLYAQPLDQNPAILLAFAFKKANGLLNFIRPLDLDLVVSVDLFRGL